MAIQMTRAEYEAKYGKPIIPVSPSPVRVQMTRAEYNEKYPPKAFTFPTAEDPVAKQNKIAEANAETARLQAESNKANSVMGFLGNFGKAFVGNIASSEVGLGKTIAKLDGKPREQLVGSIQETSDMQVKLLKAIRDKEARGEDATKMKNLYNEGVERLKGMGVDLKEVNTLPTTGKVLGQMGGTALDLATAGTYGKAKTLAMNSFKLAPSVSTATTKIATATGLPELAKIAQQKSAGLFSLRGLSNIGKGAGIGYGYDVTRGAQGDRGEDRTGGKSFIPGAGTVIGGAIPFLSEASKTGKNLLHGPTKAENLVIKRQKELDKLDRLKTLKNTTQKGLDRGIDVKKVLAETDVLHGSVDKSGKITTKGPGNAVEQYTKEFIEGNEGIVSQALKKEGRSIAPNIIKVKLDKAVMNAGIEGKALTQARKAIDDELAGYAIRGSEGGAIPLSTLHDAKVDKYNNINFFTEGNTKKYDKTVAKALKELVEDYTTDVDVKNINKELSKHFAVIDYLEKLDGRVVDGGKLGKYFAQTVGAMVGSHFGPLGTVAGAEAGGRIKGSMMSRVFSGKTGKTFPQAKVIEDAVNYRNAPPLRLP